MPKLSALFASFVAYLLAMPYPLRLSLCLQCYACVGLSATSSASVICVPELSTPSVFSVPRQFYLCLRLRFLCYAVHNFVYLSVYYTCTLSVSFVAYLLFVCLSYLFHLHSLYLICSICVCIYICYAVLTYFFVISALLIFFKIDMLYVLIKGNYDK